MPNDDFTKDLDTYIKRQRKVNALSYLESDLGPAEPLPQEEIAEDLPDADPEMMDMQKRPGFFSRLFGSGKIEEPTITEEAPLEPIDTTKDDLRALAKITMGVLHSLPKNELKIFKDSPHYSTLKDILSKHELIKK